ncbi:MAG: histidinol-phosphate transaminase [Candidatus Bathyarchaeota archaeon]
MSRKADWLNRRLEETQKIKEYSEGEYSDSTVQAKFKAGKLIKLDANENFFIPQSFFANISRELEEEMDPRLYPQSEKTELVNALSKYLEFPSECFTIGNGSDELIETAVRIFLKGSERAISISPTFSMYKLIVEAYGSVFDAVPLGEKFTLDTGGLLSKMPRGGLCFICSPNNPTGNQFEPSLVRKIAEEFEGVIVVDEAYADFASRSVKNMVKKFDNIIVLRTFSKAFGLAGLRIGYALASPKITSALKHIQIPYNVNKFSIRMASKVLEKERRQIALDAIERIKDERSRLQRRLNKINGVQAFSSEANFILFKTTRDADAIFKGLVCRGILIRNIGNIPNVGRCLRVTVGLPEMNERFIEALEEICSCD